MTHCLQRPGEVMIVPTAWWHATCNLAEFTLGIGGQDSCDLIDCTPPGPEGESQQEYHMRMQVITCMCIVPHAYAGHHMHMHSTTCVCRSSVTPCPALALARPTSTEILLGRSTEILLGILIELAWPSL